MSQNDNYKITKILEIKNEPSNNKSVLSISCTPGKNKNNVKKDVDKIKNSGYNIVLCLLTWEEMENMNMIDYPDYLKKSGILFLHMPVLDGYIPSIKEAKPVINKIVYNIVSGNNVLIHCRCGYGRAGTIASCILLHFNYSVKSSIELIRNRRKGAIQTLSQEKFIEIYQKSII